MTLRRARSVVDFIRDVRVSKAAQRDYRQAAAEIDDLADVMWQVGDCRQHDYFRHMAFVARNAARAEFFDPEPDR